MDDYISLGQALAYGNVNHWQSRWRRHKLYATEHGLTCTPPEDLELQDTFEQTSHGFR